MNAEFRTDNGATIWVETDAEAALKRVVLSVDIGPSPSRLVLSKSEARAIASALMGAAAEL